MCIVHRISDGFIISYEAIIDAKVPSTQELLSSLDPEPVASQMRDIVTKKAPAKKKKITLTCGEPSAHSSCKGRFAAPLGYEEENEQGLKRFCKWNGGRKQKGRKPTHVTICDMILN